MIQCALNGSYTREDHPDVPVTVGEIVADAVACQAAGAPSVHFHPRRPDDGRESLAAEVHDAVVAAVRAAAPDLELSCSTQEDIDLGGAPASRRSGPGPTRPTSYRSTSPRTGCSSSAPRSSTAASASRPACSPSRAPTRGSPRRGRSGSSACSSR